MPRHQGLLRRGARWFSNFKVPRELRQALGKEHIREALGTSDYREACRVVVYRLAHWRAVFEDSRRKLATERAPAAPRTRVLVSVTESEAWELAARHLVKCELKFNTFWDREGVSMDENEKEELAQGVCEDALAYDGGGGRYAPVDGTFALRRFLKESGIECAETSSAFQRLRPLFRRAQLEHSRRILDLLGGNPIVAREPAFREAFAHNAQTQGPAEATLSNLVERYASFQKDAGRAPATVMAFALPCRLLREFFGNDAPLSSLTRETMEGFCRDLKRYPINCAQRYPGKTLREAIAAADAGGDSRRLNGRTIANNFERISSLFAFAVEKKMMADNPAKDRFMRETFGKRPDKKPKAQFTVPDELNRLFSGPLYSGCVNDETGHMTPGPNHPRRGRFWIPLLGLFHGLRLNEACQLLTADVQEREGIHILSITSSDDGDEETQKRLKNRQSRREVPLHPQLKRLGFLDFVKQRRTDATSQRLFPELPKGPKGGFSESFSKWFGRFVMKTLGPECEATFHSFRHMFRDAARVARLPLDIVERLAGWEGSKSAASGMAAHYGGGPAYLRTLAEEIAKIDYPGLDLSHLYPATKPLPPMRDRES